MIHAEHAELIAALRAENAKLELKVAEVAGLRTIVDAQDKLLESSGKIMLDQANTIDRLITELRKFTEAAP